MKTKPLYPLLCSIEAGIGVIWLLLSASLIRSSDEASALPISVGSLLVAGIVMTLLFRNAKKSLPVIRGVGAAVIAVGLFGVFRVTGESGFLLFSPVAGFLFVYRVSMLMTDTDLDDWVKSNFRQESLLLPFASMFFFYYLTKFDWLPKQILIGSLILYFILRLYSMRAIQNAGKGHFDRQWKNALLLVGTITAIMLFFGILPYLFGVIVYLIAKPAEYIITNAMKLLTQFLGLDRLHQKVVETEGKMPVSNQFKDLVNDPSYVIPLWVYFLFGLVITVIAVFYFYSLRGKRGGAKIEANSHITIQRRKLRGKGGFIYEPTDSLIRQMYQKMLMAFDQRGVPMESSETPREFASRLERKFGLRNVPQGVRELSRIYERVRYGRKAEGLEDSLRKQAAEALKSVEASELVTSKKKA